MAGIEGRYGPTRKEAAFNAGRPGGAGTRSGPGYAGREEAPSASLHDRLVARFRSELAKAREGVIYSIGEEGAAENKLPLSFNTADWFSDRLYSAQAEAYDMNAPDEEWELYHSLCYAWDAVAYRQLGEKGQRHAQYCAIQNLIEDKRDSVTLSPKGVQLLDAMAEVAGLPDYQPGRTEIPIPIETMFPKNYAADLRLNYVKRG